VNIVEEQENTVKNIEDKIKYFSGLMQRQQEVNANIGKLSVDIIKQLKRNLKDEKQRLVRVKNYASDFARYGRGFEKEGGRTGTSTNNNAGTKPKNVGPAQEEDDTDSCKDK